MGGFLKQETLKTRISYLRRYFKNIEIYFTYKSLGLIITHKGNEKMGIIVCGFKIPIYLLYSCEKL